MSRATSDDQLKFLLSCVRHSNNGRVDFVEVAKECGVVSKGAAAKRYERLLKANGIHPNGVQADSISPKTPAPMKHKRKDSLGKVTSAKKRKIENTSPRPKSSEKESAQKPSAMSKRPQPEALVREVLPAISGPTGMPPPPPSFFPRAMQGYMPPSPGTRPIFPPYLPLGHTSAGSLSPGMRVHAPFGLPVGTPMSFAAPQCSLPDGLDKFNNQEMFFQPQSLPLSMQSPISNGPLRMTLPPQPQEIELLRQPRITPAPNSAREKQSAGHFVIVE
ncbi:hypothetical protein A1O3_00052 [Capronia epimyces CBS 606.96]|uniref:Myb-like DNA-binding domain-containing protein n=1 Tax=Capronia epimyces CBS 606.96 TaxID=1182542 RepID=W9ZAG0_9EURO|nr:uncharacterized protein A1O3_00052 [Capronia epimyces CBS 606.96]EXJ91504.1 hypothetical protein A1O3_00052 [Capronia epimyces CBS 606.96]